MSTGLDQAAKNIKCFIAYKLTCKSNGKAYIGITIQGLKKRWAQHVSSSRCLSNDVKLYRAMRKYGCEDFLMEHVASSFDVSNLKLLEIDLIRQYDSRRKGFNSTSGGDGIVNAKFSKKARALMSVIRISTWKSPEYRAKISSSQREAWRNKSENEIEERRQRAKVTLAAHRPIRPKRAPLFGPKRPRGFNMIVKTHCPQGHPYTHENTHVNQAGSRVCKTCKKATRNIARDRRVVAARESLRRGIT